MDIIRAFDKVRGSYIDYVKTAFGTQYPGLEQEREKLLQQPGEISQEPWIEPIPRYRSSGKKIRDLTAAELPSLNSDEIETFQDLACCGLFDDHRELYEHQVEMLRQVLSGSNAVVTAGTGSGKTESFLLPFLAYLVHESAKWPQPDPRMEHQDDWWRDNNWRQQCKKARQSQRVPQRGNENRDAAMRGLILYPMNALVEDQMSRLRSALDSDNARNWFAQNRGGNRFYFGRYNAETPIPGHERKAPTAVRGEQNPDRNRIDRLASRLKESEDAASAARHHADDTGNSAVPFFFPSLDGAEMRSRWDMQDHPPDILITNFSMLSVMLMRDADRDIFEKTRQWLEKDDSIFHLIIDELHLHRGTAGTEVAFLLKLLLLRLGLTPDSPKLRIMGSSASLEPDDPKSLRFLSEFFGSYWKNSQVIPGQPAETREIEIGEFLPTEPFVAIAKNIEMDQKTAVTKLRQATGLVSDLEDILESSDWQVGTRMLIACKKGTTTRATKLHDFGRRLFGNDSDENTMRLATRGLLAARELCSNSEHLPSFRIHWFFKNIEGLWACTQPGCGCEDYMTVGRTAGKLFTNPRILCDNIDKPHRVLDLLYCEVCGTTMFGGHRFELPDGRGWELLMSDADIEGLPDRRPANFVDRRTYQEFAIFWPSDQAQLHPDAQQWRQPASRGNTVQAQWHIASLNPATGQIKLGQKDPVSGYAFVVTDPPENAISALPATCPLCSANYRHRKYRKSPIRGFRTGFGKITQILAKEMFYFLPEEAKKLIVFSDSRQDAAVLANGIERSHYTDLVREAMYGELRKAVTKAPPPELVELAQIDNDVLANLPSAARNELEKRIAEAKEKRAHFTAHNVSRTIPLRLLFEDDNTERGTGTLIQRLKSLGVNPAGQDILFQEFKYDNDWYRWTTLFDFDNPTGGWNPRLSPEGKERGREKLRAKVTSEICAVLFSRSYFGFEASGLGYAMLDVPEETIECMATRCQISTGRLVSILSGTLRMLGDYFRYPQQDPNAYPQKSWPDWNSSRAPLRNFVKKCAGVHRINEETLLEVVWEAVCIIGGHTHCKIQPRRLSVRIALSTDPVWHCPGCRRPHLHNPGICTSGFCQRELSIDSDAICADLHERHYYAKEAVELRPPVRLHAEELTAQTDNQLERQRLFRDITVDLENDPHHPLINEVDEIDILSVTTTMEVGVDIGTLQCVVQGNMPPQRFNYQQRAGRAGRRGQPFATVLTICRGRSHDEFYYRHPEHITGDPPPTPFLSTNHPEIAQRLMAKECLRRAFLSAKVRWWESTNPPDSHGEFGLKSNWIDNRETRKDIVRKWLVSSGEVDYIASALCVGLQTIAPSGLINYVRHDLYRAIDEACANSEITCDGLAETLAEFAVLPMYGMSSRARELYHRLQHRDLLAINRDLDLAITEFAPGSQRTKDKRVYRSIGFTAPLLYRQNEWKPSSKTPWQVRRWMARCEQCHYTMTSDSKPQSVSCPNCGCDTNEQSTFHVFQFAVPLAFRTDLGGGEDSQEETEFLPTGAATVAESNSQPCQLVADTNSATALSRSGRVYQVNDKSGQLFTGAVGTTEHSKWRRVRLENQWIDQRFQQDGGFKFTPITNAQESIAIVAPKTTDVLCVRPETSPNGLQIDPVASAGVKAAYYSAAFILRAVAAGRLDIDPDEFDISNVRQVSLSDGTKAGEIIISDHLLNGAGFTAWVNENWADLLLSIIGPTDVFIEGMLAPVHRSSCDSSCYSCLRNYRNMAYHSLLDWRLGISLLRSLQSDGVTCGLDNDFTLPDLVEWVDTATKLRNLFCTSFPASVRDFGPLPGLMIGTRQVLIVHPLWDTSYPVGLLAEAMTECEQDNLQVLDTFNLLRRPAWSYQSLSTL